jgi:hypothetical protein
MKESLEATIHQISNNWDTIALLPANRCGKARAKSAYQEGQKCPVHGVRQRFARASGSLLSLKETRKP